MSAFRSIARRLLACTLGALLLIQSGCGSAVSQANYDKIKEGMTQKEVEAILGKGTTQGESSMKMPVSVPGIGDSMTAAGVTWQDGGKTIVVSFANDKVVTKMKNGF